MNDESKSIEGMDITTNKKNEKKYTTNDKVYVHVFSYDRILTSLEMRITIQQNTLTEFYFFIFFKQILRKIIKSDQMYHEQDNIKKKVSEKMS